MTDGSEKRKCQLAFDLYGQSSCVFDRYHKYSSIFVAKSREEIIMML